MEIRKLSFYLEGMIWIVGKMTIAERVTLISVALMFFGAFYVLVISPLIFNYFIIPNIEKKIGKKLEYHPFIDYIFLGRWMCRQNEIATYLINRYFAMKFKNDFGLPKYCLRFGLRKAGYTINMASKFEIAMSFFLFSSFILIVISSVVMLIATRNQPFHK